MRASGKQIGVSVGKMVFPGRDTKRIEKHLEKFGGEKLQQALVKRGAGTIDPHDIADAMSGKGRSWSQVKYKQVVAALQDVGLAQTAKSASAMVLKASRNAQDTHEISKLPKEQMEARMREFARERLAEDVEDAEGHMGVLDRARGSQGRANKVEKAVMEAAFDADRDKGKEGQDTGQAGKTVRETRELLRHDMGLKPKIAIPKPKKFEDSSAGFQA